MSLLKPQFNKTLFALCFSMLVTTLHLSVNAQTSIAEDIRQEPIAVNIKTAPNIILMMDDSASMMQTWLPAPPGINWTPLVGYSDFKSFANNSGGTTFLEQYHPSQTTPMHNPVWYNPAITYKPWNDNNKPAATNFPKANIGTIVAGNVVDQTREDMRFRIDAGVKLDVSSAVVDLFRSYGTRIIPPCLTKKFEVQNQCTGGYTTTGPFPDPGSESGVSYSRSCNGYTAVNVEVCTKWTTAPELIQGRYMRFEGAGPVDITDPTKYRLVEIDRDAPARMYPTPIDPYSGVQISRADCANPLSCTFTEEAQNFANYWTYYRNRLFAAIAVTSQVLADVDDKIRVGYGRLNYFANGPLVWSWVPSSKPPVTLPLLDGQPNPGHIVRGVRPFAIGSADRQELFDWLFGLNGVGGTPVREAMDAMGKYYKRPDVKGPWAYAPGTGDPLGTTQLACRRNFSLIATDGAWTDSPNHPRISTLYAGLPPNTPTQSDSINGPTILGAGKQTGRSYQYLVTGEPVFGGSSATQNETLSDVAMQYWATDLRPDLPNVNRPTSWSSSSGYSYPKDFSNPATWQTMTNFIVGYGLQPSVSLADAKTAMRNGTAFSWPWVDVSDPGDNKKVDDTMRAALASRGDFYTAQNPTELAAALKKVFGSLSATLGASSTLAVSTSVIRDSTDLIFEASYDTSDWSGSVRAISALDAIAGKSTKVWDANFPSDYTKRNLFSTASTGVPIAFRWDQLTIPQQTSIGSEALFKYLIGDRSLEAPLGTLRTRGSILGSVISASPLYSASTHYGYQYQLGAAGASYPAYLEYKRSTRKKAIFAGSNGGMLHGFDAATGLELFGFTPRSAIPEMKKLANPAYIHQYLVDGIITEGDAYIDGAWKTLILGSSGAGPKSLFMLDATKPDAMGAAQVLWEIDEKDEASLGHVLSGALIANTKAKKWAVIIGNGYESKNDQAALLVFDAKTGVLIRKISTGTGSKVNKKAQNGLGPVTPIYDGERNVIAVYGGDKLGNLWRFDLSNKLPSKWRITTSKGGKNLPVFTAKDAAGIAQPITSAPRITSHPLGGLYIVFGTGKTFNLDDGTDKQMQAVYGIRDKDNSGPYLKTELLQLALKDTPPDFRKLDGLTGPTGLDWSKHKGWFFELSVNGTGGERIVASPRLNAGMLTISSFDPDNPDPCEAGGKSFIYSFDLATDFSRPAFNGQDTSVIGVKTLDGVASSLTALYSPAVKSVVAKTSIDAAALKASTKDTRYSVTGGILTDNSTASFCALSANSVNNTNVTVPTACAGTTPLRVWRDLR